MNHSTVAFARRIFILALFIHFGTYLAAQVSITCPADIVQNNDIGQCGAVVNYPTPVGTGSGTGITTVLTSGLPSGSEFPVGITEVIYTVTNNEGDSNDCTFYIQVNDSEIPTYDCPPDIFVNTDPGLCTAVVFYTLPSATDNCTLINNVQTAGLPSGSAFPVGENNLTFRATDDSGNLAFCRVKIIVTDINPPVIICPADIEMNVSSTCDAVVNYIAPVGVDACGPSLTSLTAGFAPGASFPLGLTVVTYTVIDLAGNTASCSFNVTIHDIGIPAITCPADLIVNANPGQCDAIVNLTIPVVSDNCPGVNVAQTGGLLSGSVFPVGSSTVTFTATDGSGNSSSCSYDVFVIENQSPTITCPANISVNTDLAVCEAVVNYIPPTGTDNCPGAITTLISGLGSGASFPIGVTTEEYQVEDASGNVTTCSFTVTVIDLQSPFIDCGTDISADNQPGFCSAIVNFPTPSAIDNCPGVVINQTSGPVSGSVFPVGSTSVIFTATDASGNISLCTFDIVVIDTEAPVITCPADVALVIPGGNCSATVVYPDPVVSDNCPGAGFNHISGPVSGSTVMAGDYTVSFEASDAAGNIATCSFNISIGESSDPVITCPADLTVNADPGSCDAVVVFGLPGAIDSCSTVTVSQTGGPVSGSTFPVGNTTVSFTAVDAYGNTASCSYDIIVTDTQLPVIDCPANINADNDPGLCSAVVNFPTPAVSDNCAGAVISQTSGPVSGSVFPVGSTAVSFTATDASGNTSVCTILIIVNDTEAPVISCPADFAIVIPGGNCSAAVVYPDPVVSDNCPGAGFSHISGPISGSILMSGEYTVSFGALDAAGNIALCSFNISVSESSDPVINCPSELIINADPGTCDAVAVFGMPSAVDSCSTVTVSQTGGPVSGSTFPVGNTTVSFTAVDAYGNTASCSYDIIVTDTQLPVIDCPANITADNDPGLCSAVVNFPTPAVSDNCAGAVISQTDGPVSGSVFPIGSTAVSFTATDASGNTSVCTILIIVNDTETPVISCPADLAIVIPGGNCSTTVVYPDPVISDNCPGAGFSHISGPISGSNLMSGEYTVNFGALDAAGNIALCSFNISVSESSDPVITCPTELIVNADPGSCDALVLFGLPSAIDSCSTVIVSQTGGPTSGSTFPIGNTTVSFTAVDAYGNTATCSYDIIVIDTELPVVDCPGNFTANNDPGLCSAVVNFPDPLVNDNCPGAVISQTDGPASGSAFPVGSTSVSFTATDASGNISVCTFNIIVTDTELPVITCPADIDIILSDGSCETVVNFADATANDNCGVVQNTLTSGFPSGSTFNVGVHTQTFEAMDFSGNVVSCNFTITVSENVAPEITCPTNISITSEAGLCGATVNYSVPIGTDNCLGASTALTSGLGSGSFFPVGMTTEEYTVTDAGGISTTCSFTVTVTDNELPVVDCPADITVFTQPGDCEAVVFFDTPTATDNCSAILTITQVLGQPSGSVVLVGSKLVGFEIMDEAGNISYCEFEINVIDGENPVIDCPTDIVIVTPNGECTSVAVFNTPSASDNCGIDQVVQSAGPVSGSEFPIGTTNVSFTATDVNGNLTTCTFTVSVSEDVLPTIICPADIVIDTELNTCSAIVNYDLPIVSDNCGTPILTLTSGLNPGEEFPIGNTIVSYTAEDASGNISSCSFTVTVVDNQAPIFVNCPENTTLESSPGICGLIYFYSTPQALDNCDNNLTITQTQGPPSGSTLGLGSFTFEFLATDDAGHVTTCSYIITVIDDLAPIFTDCASELVFEASGADCSAQITFELPNATDNCSAEVIQINGPSSGEILPVGTYTIDFGAIDPSGNIATCQTQISIVDQTAPTIVCPDSFETCETKPEFELPEVMDNCAVATISQTGGPQSGTLFTVGPNVLTFVATDLAGNSTTCSYTITVLQNAPRPDAGPDQNICDATSTVLQGSNPDPVVGNWTQISGASANIEEPSNPVTPVNNIAVGTSTFVWTVDPENGCATASDTVNIVVEPGVLIDAGDDRLISLGGSVQIIPNYSPPDGSFIWYPEEGLSCVDCSSPFASPTTTTMYWVSFTTPLGCSKTDSLFVRVFKEIPNTITPDGDGVNDVWNLPGIESFPNVQVWIYNRWGGEVFKSSGYHDPWDGKHAGKDLPTGSYFYVIKYNLSGAEDLNGTVNIIR